MNVNKAIFWVIAVGLLLAPAFLCAQSSENVPLLVQVDDYPFTGYNDCWGYTAPDGREYALLGVLDGTSIIDITDPGNAAEITFIPSDFSTWKDIKTYQNYAYVVTESASNGLQIIDLSDLPNSATLVNTYTGFGFGSSHNINIDTDSGILYAEGTTDYNIRIISLEDPLNPVQIASIDDGGVHDVFAQDNILYVSEGWNLTFALYDVSDPAMPALITRFDTPSSGYAHQAWPTEDGSYLMTAEEVPAELTVKCWNLADAGNIILEDEYIAQPTGRPHNVHIKGNYAYISHYWDGLRIVDLSDPANLVEVGYYDTYPGNGSDFEGAWGAWPFFDSGKVLISDRSSGLYVVYFEGADLTPTGVEDQEAPIAGTFTVGQNYPNPFNPITNVDYSLAVAANVRITVYNSAGQRVRTLEQVDQSAGTYTVQWDGKGEDGSVIGSGTYFYQFEATPLSGSAAPVRTVNKMLYLK